MIVIHKAGRLILLGILPFASLACTGERTVSYSQDVRPILEANCVECHTAGGKGLEASGFDMSSYEGLMKGTNFGPMVISGDAEGSNMIVLMEGRADPSIKMPHGSIRQVSKADITILRAWIDQGAKNN